MVNGKDIKNIPWDDARAAIFELLREDFGGLLDRYFSPLETAEPGSEISQAGSDDKIDHALFPFQP